MVIPDFKNESGEWVYRVGNNKTLSAAKYVGMTNRCKEGGCYQRKKKRYVGCLCSFKGFQDFADWHVYQVGYGNGFHLDKDLIGTGKVYSRDSCVLLPMELNTFLISPKSRCRTYPIGVRYITRASRYASEMSVDGKTKHLGYFTTPEEAFQAYKVAKEQRAKELAQKWKDQIDPRAYEALMCYTVNIDD